MIASAWSFVIRLVRSFRERQRRKMNMRDLKRINASADRLNTEAEDVLKYQNL